MLSQVLSRVHKLLNYLMIKYNLTLIVGIYFFIKFVFDSSFVIENLKLLLVLGVLSLVEELLIERFVKNHYTYFFKFFIIIELVLIGVYFSV